MNGVPTSWEVYSILPYQYPLFDAQPLVRIPVAGPPPFNTLVVVRGKVGGQGDWATGKIQRYRGNIGTPFVLVGFDPRVKPPSKHSTTIALQMLQQSNDGAFLTAVDSVDNAFFDSSGRWIITFSTATQAHEVFATEFYYSSWVLCYEPPVDPRLPHGNRQMSHTQFSPGTTFAQVQEGEPTAWGGSLERLVKRRRPRQGDVAADREPRPTDAPGSNREVPCEDEPPDDR